MEIAPEPTSNTNKSYDYNPTKYTFDTFYNPSIFPNKTSVAINYMRGVLCLDFADKRGEEDIFKISRRIPIMSLYALSEFVQKNIVGVRLNIARFITADGTSPETLNYPEINVDLSTYTSIYYDKNTGDFVENGALWFSTIPVEGINRVAINASDIKGNIISVVLYREGVAQSFAKISSIGLFEAKDIALYHFGLILQGAHHPSTLLTYAIGDKMQQTLSRIFPILKPPPYGRNNSEKKSFFDNFKKKEVNYERTAEVREVSPSGEDGVDLFDDE